MESLCTSKQNKRDIALFEQATSGDKIAQYLRNEAWDDDQARNTKVYLVKDKVTNEIVYYFAINCGILYRELEEVQLEDAEKEPFERYIKAVQMAQRKWSTSSQQDIANKEYADAMQDLYDAAGNPDRATNLFSIAEDKALAKEEEKGLFADTEEKIHTTNVQETFPAIDIKFLCRNKKYIPGIHLDFKLGVYIFWEMIVPHLLRVSEMVGCRYIYLFAADNSDRGTDKVKEPIMYTPDFDPFEDDELEERKEVLRLVDYYQRELKFEFVTKYKILKPQFERSCFTLIQEVDALQDNRDRVWLTLIPDDEMEEG
jgi:hypothetical protein